MSGRCGICEKPLVNDGLACDCHLRCPLHSDTLYTARQTTDQSNKQIVLWVCTKCENHEPENIGHE